MGTFYTEKVRSIIFIILIAIMAALIVPVKNKLVNFADSTVDALTKSFKEKTGLSVSYDSLSPSLLSNFSIRGIVISDDDDNSLLTIRKTRVNYKLFSLIKGDIQKGITSITIDGINVDVDQVLELKNALAKNSGDNSQEKKESQSANTQLFSLSDLTSKIPGNIRLKNITLEYETNVLRAVSQLKDISLVNNQRRNIISYQINSHNSLTLLKQRESVFSEIGINGTILNTLDSAQMNIRFSNFTNGNYRLNRLNLLANYEKSKVTVKTVQAVNPVSISALLNLETRDFEAYVKSENLSPTSLVTINSKQKELSRLKKLKINTDSKFAINLDSGKMDYASKGFVNVPEELFREGVLVSYDISGNEKKISVNSITADGKAVNGNMNLSYEFDSMRTSGFIDLPYFVLPSGNAVSTEVYFDPLDKGFMAFSPQVFVGSKSLTALQFEFMPQDDSYDFAFEMNDYAHADSGSHGLFNIDGSYLLNSKYLQTSFSLNSVYLDSIAEVAAQIAGGAFESKFNDLRPMLEQYMITTDSYFSTDLKSVSYNVPVAMLANTKKENQFLLIALNGNEQSVTLNQLSLVSGKFAIEATGSLDRGIDNSDLFFVTDINYASVPYHFSGTIMPEVVTVSGDYGVDFEARFDKDLITGHGLFENFPVIFGDNSVIFSTDTSFRISAADGPQVQISRLEVELADASVSVSPRLIISGNATKYGAQLNSISYSDFYSTLEGGADLVLNVNDKIFDSAGLVMNLKNPLSEESVFMDSTVSNPDRQALSLDAITKSLYINSQIQLNRFSLNRYTLQKSDDNSVTGTLFAAGTIEHPYISLSLDDASVLVANKLISAKGNVILEDKDLSVLDLNVGFGNLMLSEIRADFSLDKMEGSAECLMENTVVGHSVAAPLKLSVTNAIKAAGSILPDSYTVTLASSKVSGDFIKKPFDFSVSMMRYGGNYSIFSSENVGMYGNYYDSGEIDFTWNNHDFINFNLLGILRYGQMNMNISDMSLNLKKIFSYLNFDNLVVVENGDVEGSIIISGSVDDPDINGQLLVKKPEARVPIIFPDKLATDYADIDIIHNEIFIRDALYSVKKGAQRLNANCQIFLNKWSMDHLDANMTTIKNEVVPAKFVTADFTVEGEVACDLNLNYEKRTITISGLLHGDKVDFNSAVSRVVGKDDTGRKKRYTVLCDLQAILGNHSTLNIDPLLRCVFVPNSSVNIRKDDESFYLEGELEIKSGDVSYLNRNFYIKSGTIKFNPLELTNPLITVNAETRERDTDGQNVSIIFNVEKQYLKSITPRFSSIPAKSEYEIQSLLGQIALADSTSASSLLFSATDYAIQSVLGRQVENKLRDLFNFDIFSVRTNFIQNTLNLGLSGDLQKQSISVGNFFDNSTVYIGKYLGSNLYIDAMLHATFENDDPYDLSSNGQLIFQPEVGMELESPFGNIRWNMAPDLNALKNKEFVPNTSVTLSWKFNF